MKGCSRVVDYGSMIRSLLMQVSLALSSRYAPDVFDSCQQLHVTPHRVQLARSTAKVLMDDQYMPTSITWNTDTLAQLESALNLGKWPGERPRVVRLSSLVSAERPGAAPKALTPSPRDRIRVAAQVSPVSAV